MPPQTNCLTISSPRSMSTMAQPEAEAEEQDRKVVEVVRIAEALTLGEVEELRYTWNSVTENDS